MFSLASFIALKRFITPTTIIVILGLGLFSWYQSTVISSHKVTIKNQSEKIVSLESDNRANQKSIRSIKISNDSMAEKIMSQNRRIEKIQIDYDASVYAHQQRIVDMNHKYEREIKRILGSVPPKTPEFDCTRDKNKAIDAIQAMEFLLMEAQNAI